MITIDPNILISDLGEAYPEVALFLTTEYGFHCVGCFASQFDTLIEGARIHGIEGDDFDEMLTKINNIINSEENHK
jgi:hybrid cluster-associated redox disulfide protein